MSQEKDQPSSRLRSSPRDKSVESQPESDKKTESQSHPLSHATISSASSIFSKESDETSHGTSVGEQGSPKKIGSSLRNLSKFWKSHKRSRTADVLPSQSGNVERIKAQFETQYPSKISEEDENRVERQRSESNSKSKSKSKSPVDEEIRKNQDQDKSQSREEVPKEPSPTKKPIKISDEYIKETLGISLDDWPYSEELLLSTIQLQTEKEKTKKHHLKLSSIQNSIDLIKLSVETGIPPNLIPNLFVSHEQTQELINKLARKKHELEEAPGNTENIRPHQFQFQTSQSKHSRSNSQSDLTSQPSTISQAQTQPQNQSQSQSQPQSSSKNSSTSVFKVNIPQQTQFQFHHWQKPVQGSGSNTTQQESDKKRKLSSDEISTSNLPKPQTPNRFTHTSSHRRHQSEATVAQLKNMFEPQLQHQQPPLQNQPQPPQPPQQQPWGSRALGSPYYPARESRPVYYQFPAPPNQQAGYPQQIVQQPPVYQIPPYQGQPTPQAQPQQYKYPPPQFYQQAPPPPQFVFPPKPPQSSSTHGTPQKLESTIQPGSLPPPSSSGQPMAPYRESSSIQGSPISMKRGSSSSIRDKGKSDVNFLISTPNNPPKR